jgi:hypothetical protein
MMAEGEGEGGKKGGGRWARGSEREGERVKEKRKTRAGWLVNSFFYLRTVQ